MPEGARHALVVATAKYKDEALRKLMAPGNDATAFATVLRDPAIGGFSVTTALDKDKAAVELAIDRFFAGKSPDDTVLLYFSGHGLKDDAGNLYLAARNTTRGLLRSTGISDGFLRDVMKACRARSQVLILDCCFGGAFARGLLSKGVNDTVDVNERFQGQGRVILTASTAMEFAFEDEEVDGEGVLSVFTKTLVEGLRTGDADQGDKLISVQDLYEYAYKRIALPGSKQTPTISAIGQEGSIYVAYVPEAALARRAGQRLAATQPNQIRAHDLRPYVRIRDQGPEGSSAAMAAVTAMETYLGAQGNPVELSPRYLYQKSKQIAGTEQGQDNGVMMTDLIKVLEEYGACLETDWPYESGKWQLPEGATWDTLDEKAKPYRTRVFPISTADEIAFHLGRGRPVLATFGVYDSTFYDSVVARLGRMAKVPDKKKETLIGGVVTTIVDLDEDARAIRFAHTWGTSWGDAGFGEMSFEVAQATLFDDEMWAIEIRSQAGFGWTSIPRPVTPVIEHPSTASTETPESATVETTRPARRRSTQATPRTRRRATSTSPRPPSVPGQPSRLIYDARHSMGTWSTDEALVRKEGDPPTGDIAVDETYDGLGAFYRFFWEVFQRDSWDGKGGSLEAVVHYGRDYDNGFWDGQRLVLGDGSAAISRLYKLDVVAKECAMGLVQTETDLEYAGQPGAIFQSLGQVFASLVLQYHLGQTAMEASWLLGEGVVKNGKALLSLETPGSAYDDPVIGKDPQVGHISEYKKLDYDNGGVHINCGIGNRAFVSVAKALEGHAWERAGRIWYEATSGHKLGKATTFRQFAKLTLDIAKAQYAAEPAVTSAVREAWSNVGIKV